MSATSELAARIEGAQHYLNEQVELPAWDDFARAHGEALPRAGGSPDERLDAILDTTKRHCDFRGKLMEELGRPVERWELDYSDGQWSERLGLLGIDDPASKTSQDMVGIEDALGLVRATTLPEGADPKIIKALACAGPSVAQRIQKTYGLKITPATPDGSFHFERIVDEQAPEALRNSDKLRVTTASFRALDDRQIVRNGVTLPSEVAQVQGFAPGAETEFDLTVAATGLALGNVAVQEETVLSYPGYEFEGRPGVVVTHTIDGVLRAVNIGVPLPTIGERERNRAQTQHAYRALNAALTAVAPGSLSVDTPVAIVTNAEYGPFQHTSAVNSSIEPGWVPHTVTYTAEETGITRLIEQPQLRLMPEIHSLAMNLTWLRSHIGLLRS